MMMIIFQLANYVKRLIIINFAREIKAAENYVDEMSYNNEILINNKIKVASWLVSIDIKFI